MAAQRELVLLLAADAALFGDRLGAHAHVLVVPRRPQPVVDDRVLHGRVAHAIAEARPGSRCGPWLMLSMPPATTTRRIAGADGVRRLVDRFQTRGAHLVERGGVGRGRDARGDGRLARRRLADAGLDDLAHDHLVDDRGVDVRALDSAARMAVAPSSVAGTVASPPSILPIGVRAALNR